MHNLKWGVGRSLSNRAKRRAGALASLVLVSCTNQSPEVPADALLLTSEPSDIAVVGTTYYYSPALSEEGAVTWTLTAGPEGMSFEEGVLTWTPTSEDEGTHDVTIEASFDGELLSQEFSVSVGTIEEWATADFSGESGGDLGVLAPGSPIARASLHVPPGAFEGEQTLSISSLDFEQIERDSQAFQQSSVVFGPVGTSFQTPVTVGLPFDPQAVMAGTEVAARAFDQVSGSWAPVEVLYVDNNNGIVFAEVSVFPPAMQIVNRVPTMDVAAGTTSDPATAIALGQVQLASTDPSRVEGLEATARSLGATTLEDVLEAATFSGSIQCRQLMRSYVQTSLLDQDETVSTLYIPPQRRGARVVHFTSGMAPLYVAQYASMDATAVADALRRLGGFAMVTRHRIPASLFGYQTFKASLYCRYRSGDIGAEMLDVGGLVAAGKYEGPLLALGEDNNSNLLRDALDVGGAVANQPVRIDVGPAKPHWKYYVDPTTGQTLSAPAPLYVVDGPLRPMLLTVGGVPVFATKSPGDGGSWSITSSTNFTYDNGMSINLSIDNPSGDPFRTQFVTASEIPLSQVTTAADRSEVCPNNWAGEAVVAFNGTVHGRAVSASQRVWLQSRNCPVYFESDPNPRPNVFVTPTERVIKVGQSARLTCASDAYRPDGHTLRWVFQGADNGVTTYFNDAFVLVNDIDVQLRDVIQPQVNAVFTPTTPGTYDLQCVGWIWRSPVFSFTDSPVVRLAAYPEEQIVVLPATIALLPSVTLPVSLTGVVGGAVNVMAFVTDPDTTAAPSFLWSASGGGQVVANSAGDAVSVTFEMPGVYELEVEVQSGEDIVRQAVEILVLSETVSDSAVDADADGFAAGADSSGDCNDGDANVHPGAVELCGTEVDSNCDGVSTTTDCDRDGFIAGATASDDCDDSDPSRNPDARELCNEVDDNCSGATDEGFQLGESCSNSVEECTSTGVYVCSADPHYASCTASPPISLEESCNEADDDCDGQTDEGDVCEEACDGADNDDDGEIDEGLGVGEACAAGQGDCQASGVMICGPSNTMVCDAVEGAGSEEVCDGRDNDCDGSTDEGLDC